jgi:hypothetical protein
MALVVEVSYHMLRNRELGRNIPNNAAETSSQRKGGSEGIRFRDGL